MKVGTKIQMNNGALGIQQGLIIEDDGWGGICRWDSPEEFDTEELGDNFEEFEGVVLSDSYEFKYINDNGSLK